MGGKVLVRKGEEKPMHKVTNLLGGSVKGENWGGGEASGGQRRVRGRGGEGQTKGGRQWCNCPLNDPGLR